MVGYRPSGANRAVNCHGSVDMVPLFPRLPQSESAREGQAAHWVAEMLIKGDQFSDASELADRQAPNGIYVTGAMPNDVEIYLETLESIAPLDAWTIERKLEIPHIYQGYGGTPDAYWHDTVGQVLYIVDFKYGRKTVEIEHNWQLASYAAHWAAELSIKTFVFIIVQPRASHPAGSVRTWRQTHDEMSFFHWPKLQAVMSDARRMCHAGAHCYMCPAAYGCEALRKSVGVSFDLAGAALPEEMNPAQLAFELEQTAIAARNLEDRKTAIETHALELCKQHINAVPGYTTTRNPGRERMTDSDAYKTVEALTGLPLHKIVPFTPKQMADAGVDRALIEGLGTDRPLGQLKLVKYSKSLIGEMKNANV